MNSAIRSSSKERRGERPTLVPRMDPTRLLVAGQTDAAHEVVEARVGAERFQQWVHVEPDHSVSALLEGPFQPGERLLFVAEARIGPYDSERRHESAFLRFNPLQFAHQLQCLLPLAGPRVRMRQRPQNKG